MALTPPAVALPPPHLRDEHWFVVLKDIVDRLNAGVLQGLGSPEGVVTAGPGTVYRRLDGVFPALWVKESAASLSTGWRSL